MVRCSKISHLWSREIRAVHLHCPFCGKYNMEAVDIITNSADVIVDSKKKE